MKKIIYLLSVLSLPLFSFADLLPEPFDKDTKEIEDTSFELDELETSEIDIEENSESSENNFIESNVKATEVMEEEELHDVGADGGLTWISFGYCNEGIDNLSNTLNYAINQGNPFKVCIMMSNSANEDVKVRVRLVDLINGLCSVNDTSIYQFISPDDIKDFDEITIPAGNYVFKEFSILYPIGIEGNQGACTMFNIVKDGESQGNIAAVVNRAYPMRFFVGTIDDIKNIISIDNIELSLDDNKDLIMNFDIKNEGNLENLVELSGTISNIFGYNKKFSIEGGHVLPGGLWHVQANLGSIPSYGGLFSINFKAFATPYFSYDISRSSVDPSLIETKTFDFSTSYFKMPWLIFAVIIILILLIITMFKKPKQKVVYVQQPVQPTQQYYPQQNSPQQPVQPTQQYYPQQNSLQQPAQPTQQYYPQQNNSQQSTQQAAEQQQFGGQNTPQ